MDSHYLTVDGYRLHWLELGRGPAVLMIHGFARSAEDWRTTGSALASMGYRVLAVDALGFGRSDKPDKIRYSLALMAKLFAGLLDGLGLERAFFVGHSMGGKYALGTAVLQPDRVAGLGLVGSDGFVRSPVLTQTGGWPVVGHMLLWLSSRPFVVRAMYEASFANPKPIVTEDFLAIGRAAMLGPENSRALMSLSRCYATIDVNRTGIRKRFSQIKVPTLLIWGDQDRVFPVERTGRIAAASIPGAHLAVIPNCGHFPHLETPRALAGLLGGFLAHTSQVAPW
ncbi:MAG: alpha/beta fold hydrolase [Candidatus Viridilinea halotolerans]|uniref:Alpha/beta fold hydrolase n=1 Tax=Candidatus Viridilinea halotolerans TaxID=2491704 RepID=A0A426TT32_9CHLR|nr:MAG: alpha/beta fold hydrolase [Candidatus Viridilinea halotolerans]